MLAPLIRLGIIGLACLLILLIILVARLFIARQRRFALAAAPLDDPAIKTDRKRTCILAFSSPGCTQCHNLQVPALRRLQEIRGEDVDVVEVDASTSPKLVKRYRVLTVPSTVVLKANGEIHAVNYGFANLEKLRQQVEDLL